MFTENGGPVYFGPAMLTDADNKPCDQTVIWMSVTIQNRPDGDKETVMFDETLLGDLLLINLDNGFRIEAPDQLHGAPIQQFDTIVDSIKYNNVADDPEPLAEPTLGIRHIIFKVRLAPHMCVPSNHLYCLIKTNANSVVRVRGKDTSHHRLWSFLTHRCQTYIIYTVKYIANCTQDSITLIDHTDSNP